MRTKKKSDEKILRKNDNLGYDLRFKYYYKAHFLL